MRSTFTSLTWTLAASVALSGCWVGKTICRGLGGAMPGQCKADDSGDQDGASGIVSGTQTVGGDTPVVPTEEVTEVAHGSGFALIRLTPEQLSKNLRATTNIGAAFEYTDPNVGQTLDYLQMLFGVPLGGIDFVTTARRDFSTKAQTLLVSRVIAWQFASMSIWTEWDAAPGDRVVFTECNMGEDVPFQAEYLTYPAHVQSNLRAGEERWGKQVEALFWRAYGRAATTADKAAVRTAFIDAFNAEGYPQAAWVVVMYAILSSQDFWHS